MPALYAVGLAVAFVLGAASPYLADRYFNRGGYTR
jgi:hypothetical protein